MDIANSINTAMSLLGPENASLKISDIARVPIRKIIKQGEGKLSTDSISVRLRNISSSHSRLIQTRDTVAIEQTRYSIAQKVQGGMESILGELEEIGRLNESVAGGEMSEDQIKDVQIMIESRLAWINNIASGTTWSGQSLLTGDAVRITTESITNSGFDVSYPPVNTESLGISDLNVVTMDSDEVSRLISDAKTSLESYIESANTEMSVIESSLEAGISELGQSFANLRQSERLNTSPASGRLNTENMMNSLRAADLNSLLSGAGLNPENASMLIK
jgi:flagellin-like hook-associated protein FlgL